MHPAIAASAAAVADAALPMIARMGPHSRSSAEQSRALGFQSALLWAWNQGGLACGVESLL